MGSSIPEALDGEVRGLTAAAGAIRGELRRRNLILFWGAILVVVALVALAVVSWHQQQQLDKAQRLACGYLAAQIPDRGQPTPQTPYGRGIAREAAELYEQFDCGSKP